MYVHTCSCTNVPGHATSRRGPSRQIPSPFRDALARSRVQVRRLDALCNTSLPRMQRQVLHELRHLPVYAAVKEAVLARSVVSAGATPPQGDGGSAYAARCGAGNRPGAADDATQTSADDAAVLAAAAAEDDSDGGAAVALAPAPAPADDPGGAAAAARSGTWLLVERAAVLLHLCLPAIEKCDALLRAVGDTAADASDAGGDGGQHAHRVLAELVELLQGWNPSSSLVGQEFAFMRQQLPELHILDGSVDAWSEGYFGCTVCSASQKCVSSN